jgi:hypothetical protein
MKDIIVVVPTLSIITLKRNEFAQNQYQTAEAYIHDYY